MRISVITVCFNSQNTIADTLESVLNQSYDNIEIIVVDGKSSDDTVSIIERYESLFNKARRSYRWISEDDTGIYDAINKGIRLATGDIIGILNSDDYFYDHDVVADIVDQFKSQQIDCLYGNLVYVNSKRMVTRRWISRGFVDGLFEKSWTPGHPTFYCRKEVYKIYGLYKTDYKIAADVELMYRFLVKHKVNCYYLNRYFVVMRQGGVSSQGLQSTITITREVRKAIGDNGGKFNLARYLFYKALKMREIVAR